VNLYEILKVMSDATAEQIKKAYRREAQKAHPDREGGNQDKFHSIAVAYEVLSDPGRREKYDATGDIDEQPNAVEGKLAELFSALIDAGKFEGDIVLTCRDHIKAAISQLNDQINKITLENEKLIKQLGRIASDDFNLYEQILQSKIDNFEKVIAQAIAERELLGDVIEALSHYNDESPQIVTCAQFTGLGQQLGGLGNVMGGTQGP